MDILILAGAKNSGLLSRYSDTPWEAGIRIGQRTILDHVILALTGVAGVDRLAVIGPEECIGAEARQAVWRVVAPGASMLENLCRGLEALMPKDKVLVVTADVPLLTKEAIEDFLKRCREREADAYYPLVAKELIETRYPGAHRTYFRLKQGTFTGGNIFLLAREIVDQHTDMLEKVISLRKKPLQIGRLLGLRYLLKFALGRLSIGEVEKKIAKKLQVKGAAVITPFPEIGIDVDKPSDLELVQKILNA